MIYVSSIRFKSPYATPEIIPIIGPNQYPGKQATSIENKVTEPPKGNFANLM